MVKIWKTIKENPKIREKIQKRALILKAIREFFEIENFLEVETPCLVKSPDPCIYNEVFKIEGKKLYLTPSPEFFLKKALVGGLKNIYQITHAFRDWQENDPLHLSEFIILEWYRTNADYQKLMDDCENLILHIAKRINPETEIPELIYNGQKIELSSPWIKISCKEAFEKYAGINLDEFMDLKNAKEICQNRGYQVSKKNNFEELYHQIFLNEIEPKLPKEKPVIIYDYPYFLAALAKIKKENPNYAERFEFYIGGLELGNGYSELTDWQEQEIRLKKDINERKKRKMKTFEYDRDFIEALKEGLPETAGIAVGIDRLIMLFTDTTNIRDVSPFFI